VICIGLLGVLAVIPYGAYQTAKARNAEHTSWILDAAAKDLRTMELAKPENWMTQNATPTQLTAINVMENDPPANVFLNHSTSASRILNCSRFLMVDPFGDINTPINNSPHISQIGANFNNPQMNQQLLCNRMTGQDDLVYTTHSDKRTDFSGQEGKILSSGQYTWFFMFRPDVDTSNYTVNPPHTSVPWTNASDNDNIQQNANIDILACYNRVPGTEQTVSIDPDSFVQYYGNSISVKIPIGDYDFKNTKYVFLSWGDITTDNAAGGWYKVINVTEPDPVNSTRDVFLMYNGGDRYAGEISQPSMLIISGVMYHKRVTDVPIR
jgi:hypothetical protein